MKSFIALLALAALLPVVGAGAFMVSQSLAPESELAGLVQVDKETHYGWVVTAGQYKGQTTDPIYVLQVPKKDRPPAAFKKLTCVAYADSDEVTLSTRAVQVCNAVTVSEAEVRDAMGKDSPPPGVPAMP